MGMQLDNPCAEARIHQQLARAVPLGRGPRTDHHDALFLSLYQYILGYFRGGDGRARER